MMFCTLYAMLEVILQAWRSIGGSDLFLGRFVKVSDVDMGISGQHR